MRRLPRVGRVVARAAGEGDAGWVGGAAGEGWIYGEYQQVRMAPTGADAGGYAVSKEPGLRHKSRLIASLTDRAFQTVL